MIRGQVAERKRWGIGFAEPVAMSEKPELSARVLKWALGTIHPPRSKRKVHDSVVGVGFGALTGTCQVMLPAIWSPSYYIYWHGGPSVTETILLAQNQ